MAAALAMEPSLGSLGHLAKFISNSAIWAANDGGTDGHSILKRPRVLASSRPIRPYNERSGLVSALAAGSIHPPTRASGDSSFHEPRYRFRRLCSFPNQLPCRISSRNNGVVTEMAADRLLVSTPVIPLNLDGMKDTFEID